MSETTESSKSGNSGPGEGERRPSGISKKEAKALAKAEKKRAKAEVKRAKAEAQAQSEKEKITFETFMTRREAHAYFSAIVEGLESGTLQFRQEDGEISLDLPEHVEVKIKAKRKGTKNKVSFRIAWDDAEQSTLHIASD